MLVTDQRHLLVLLLPISQLRVLRRIHLILFVSGPDLQPRWRQLAVTPAVQILPLRLPLLRPHLLDIDGHHNPGVAVIALIHLIPQHFSIPLGIYYLR